MKNFSKLNTLAGVIAASVAFGAAALPALAAPTTVGEFAVNNGSGNAFAFTNNGAASTLTNITPGVAVPVEFEYTTSANSYNDMAGVLIPATLLINSTVASTDTSGAVDIQPMSNVSITILADVPIGPLDNLLSVTASSSGLAYGVDGSHTANLEGDSSVGNTVTLTSDFLSGLDTATVQTFALEFTNVTPPVGTANPRNGYLDSFTGNGTGSFASDFNTGSPGVPEPASIALLGLGALGTLVRRRKGTRA